MSCSQLKTKVGGRVTDWRKTSDSHSARQPLLLYSLATAGTAYRGAVAGVVGVEADKSIARCLALPEPTPLGGI
jgi:hypothetical protein